MAKRFKYTSRIKPESQGGMAALLMAALSVFLFMVSVIISYAFAGDAGNILGVVGLVGLLLAVAGFIIGIKSFAEKEKSHRFTTIASIINGIVAVIWLALYLVGIS
jgi:hypothetical protein